MQIPSNMFAAAFVLLWATGFIGARYAMPWAEPFSFLSLRFVLAFAILGLTALLIGPGKWSARGAFHAIFAGILIHGVYLGGVFWAIRHGMPAGLSALVIGLQPLLTALLAGPIAGETIRPRLWFALAAGLFGVALVMEPGLQAGVSGVTATTLIATFIGVVGISIGTVLQKRYGTGLNLATGTAFQYLGGAVLMAIFAACFETGQFIWSGELVFAMVWLVFVLSIGAVYLLMYLIREGSVSQVASLFYLVPAVTALIAWPLFGETLGPVQIIGMAIVTFAVALANGPEPGQRVSGL